MGQERLRVVTAKELISVLERLGFRASSRKSTGHRRYVHPGGRRTTVPMHAGRDIGRGLLRKILRDIEIAPEEFTELL